ncbi:inorganic phosphate transporter [Criblamydia sequanensis]|uniref:Phosphate transporter n=1 Tax=Candidatus Criblamydia sequanensis CRIB-18 TaxID=1437425 RepID=A0A090CYX0_9BACT|nr:inorganic phosphate transporter [Criblamydia sequanensis]CDR33796.1 Phosphate transporter [Criblamydia sequanensis CRIB-18]
MDESVLLFIVLALVLGAEVVNGWTDAPNAIATVISTRTLTPRAAILMATIFNILGAFYGTKVAETIGSGIVKPEAINLVSLGASLLALILWSLFAWRFGLPTSESHALVAGLAGASLAIGGLDVLLFEGWVKVAIGLFFSTFLGTLIGYLITKAIIFKFHDANPAKTKKAFKHLQVLSAAFMAFSHGSNDGQKFIGVFSLTLFLGNLLPEFKIPFWVILLCALVMGISTSIGGMRIIKTLGIKIIHLETYQGFAAESAASLTILFASTFGIPLSTTHTISTAIIGTGMARRVNEVRWNVVTRIIYAWLLTFPLCGLIAFILSSAFMHLNWAGDLLVIGILIALATFLRPKFWR